MVINNHRHSPSAGIVEDNGLTLEDDSHVLHMVRHVQTVQNKIISLSTAGNQGINELSTWWHFIIMNVTHFLITLPE